MCLGGEGGTGKGVAMRVGEGKCRNRGWTKPTIWDLYFTSSLPKSLSELCSSSPLPVRKLKLEDLNYLAKGQRRENPFVFPLLALPLPSVSGQLLPGPYIRWGWLVSGLQTHLCDAQNQHCFISLQEPKLVLKEKSNLNTTSKAPCGLSPVPPWPSPPSTATLPLWFQNTFSINCPWG